MAYPERSRGQGFGHVNLLQLDASWEFKLCTGDNGQSQPPCVIRELQWIEIQGVQRHRVRDHSQPAGCQRCSMLAIRRSCIPGSGPECRPLWPVDGSVYHRKCFNRICSLNDRGVGSADGRCVEMKVCVLARSCW